MSSRNRFILVLIVGFTLICPAYSAHAAAKIGPDYFQGKTMTFLVPFKPGGGFDTYARLLSPYIKKYLHVSKVIVKNEPAAGGLAATNMLARSKPDGTTIMIFQTTGTVLNELAGVKGLQYKSGELTWLARLTSSAFVMVVSSKSDFKTIEDMKAANRQILIGGVGRDFASMTAQVLCTAFGIPHRSVMGYGGSGEIILGIIRGEVDTCAFSYPSVRASMKAGELRGILVMGLDPVKGLDVPLASTVADQMGISEKKKGMLRSIASLLNVYRALATSPGTSPELSKFMRDAFAKAINDPGFLAACKKNNRPIDFLNGEKTQQLLAESVEALKNDQESLQMIKSTFGE